MHLWGWLLLCNHLKRNTQYDKIDLKQKKGKSVTISGNLGSYLANRSDVNAEKILLKNYVSLFQLHSDSDLTRVY